MKPETPPLAQANLPAPVPTGAKVTLRDIARHLGVSHVAVSLALRDRPGVSPELRDRIRSEAERLGYIPDRLLGALNGYRHRRNAKPSVAWITLWRDPSLLHTNPNLAACLRGARSIAQREGYLFHEFHPAPDGSINHLRQELMAREVHGILLSAPDCHFAEHPVELDWSRFSVVSLHPESSPHPFRLVSDAAAANAAQAVRHMHDLGYRRIGFVGEHATLNRNQALSGFLLGTRSLHSGASIPPLGLSCTHPTADQSLLRNWIDHHRPDAVLGCIHPLPSLLRRLRFKIPSHLGCALTCLPDGDPSSGIYHDSFGMGGIACESLLSLMLHGHRGVPTAPTQTLVEGTWHAGVSLRQIPAKLSVHEPKLATLTEA